MTTQELNRDVKRLYKAFLDKKSDNTASWTNKDWNDLERKDNELKEEFKRLYYADRNFDYMSKQSLLIMLAINNSLRVITFHVFGAITIK